MSVVIPANSWTPTPSAPLDRSMVALVSSHDPRLGDQLRQAMAESGFQVELAGDALSLIARMRNPAPLHLVLVDGVMPACRGGGIAAELHDACPGQRDRTIILAPPEALADIARSAPGWRTLRTPIGPKLLRLLVEPIVRPAPPRADGAHPGVGYQWVVILAREALRRADWIEAEELLMRARTIHDRDPAVLNLIGILHELRGDLTGARRYYGRATRADRLYRPARQNIRRMFELLMLGRTDMPVLYGDEMPVVDMPRAASTGRCRRWIGRARSMLVRIFLGMVSLH